MKYKYLLVGCTFFLAYFFITKDNVSTTVNDTLKSKKTTVIESPYEKIIKEKAERKRNGGVKKFDEPDKFAEFHHLIRTRDGESKPSYESNYKISELNKAIKNKPVSNARQADLPWTERGPANVGGRTRALLVLPQDATHDTWLAGSTGGGIWKTTDGGTSWTYKSKGFTSLAVTSLALCESNPGTIYAGTGEEIASAWTPIAGDGIFKSTDSGETWTQLSATAKNNDFRSVNRIIVSPDDPNIMLASTSSNTYDADDVSYILRTIDGGANWTRTYTSINSVTQIAATPGNFNVQYAAESGTGVLKSTDGGITWTSSSNGLVSISGRIEMAIAPTKTDRVFLSVVGGASGNTSDLYMTDDAGANWELVLTPNGGTNIDFLGGQGWYDNTIAVDPYNENVVYYAGVNVWRNTVSDEKETGSGIVNIRVDDTETSSFFSVVNFGGTHYGGGLDLGSSPEADFVSIEIRFGAGATQKAHRFTIPVGETSGVPASDYTYQDYVDVPFEVWDTDNNKQLMVSFRDQQDDGIFQLYETGGEPEAREYLYISSLAYDANAPNDNMAVVAGHEINQLYFFWPVLTVGATWDPANMAAAKLVLTHEKLDVSVRLGTTKNVSDAYNEFDMINVVFGNSDPNAFHPDHHGLTMVKMDEAAKTYKIINTSDGGVYSSNVAAEPGILDGDWTFKSIGYNTGQFYGADKMPGGSRYVGGMQDNGTWTSPASEDASSTSMYVPSIGGDGFQALWNYADPLKIIGGSQSNGIRRTIDGGVTWTSGTRGLTGGGPFITKLASSNSSPDIIFSITDRGVFRSTNFGESWDGTAISDNWGFSSNSNVVVSLANPDIVWAGAGMTSTFNFHVSSDNGLSFSDVPNFTDVNMGRSTGFGTHPTEANTGYALFSFRGAPKVLRTKDLGQTWEDISGFGQNSTSSTGFPDVAVYSLLVLPHETSTIWAGTEIGIIESKDNGATWGLADNGFPAVAVWQMKVVDDQVVVATHGRGIWSVTIPEIPAIIVGPSLKGLGTAVSGGLNVQFGLNSAYDSSWVFVDDVATMKIDANTEAEVKTISIAGVSTTEFLNVEIKSYKNKVTFKSSKDSTLVFETNPIQAEYVNDLNDGSTDFLIKDKDFLITKFSGFDNFALHSKHDYEEGSTFDEGFKNYITILRTPVKVNAENAILSYKDVAIVEIGEDNIPFGIQEFWDYVIVEGTTDGINWTPILDGYDANYDPAWLAAYTAGGKGDATMFKKHSINLLDTYEAGDEVMFRFRLFSDANTAGYGWVIDDITIQGTITSIPELIERTSLSVYPNPSNNNLTITFDLPKAARTSVKVLGIDGQVVATYQMNILNKGRAEKTIDIQNLKRGLYLLSLETDFGKITKRFVKD